MNFFLNMVTTSGSKIAISNLSGSRCNLLVYVVDQK
jgi:hypothetical protein